MTFSMTPRRGKNVINVSRPQFISVSIMHDSIDLLGQNENIVWVHAMQCSETGLEKLEPLLLMRNEWQDPHECSDSSTRHLFICKRNSSDLAMWIVRLR